MRLLQEARAASALDHPNICTVYEVGDHEGQAFIVMEHVEGKPLSQLIPSDGLLPESVIRYGTQIADALAHAHEHGVVHRDLKSQNVVITPDGRAKVLDFGLAARMPRGGNEDAGRPSSRRNAGGDTRLHGPGGAQSWPPSLAARVSICCVGSSCVTPEVAGAWFPPTLQMVMPGDRRRGPEPAYVIFPRAAIGSCSITVSPSTRQTSSTRFDTTQE